jgi:hypothetical protein
MTQGISTQEPIAEAIRRLITGKPAHLDKIASALGIPTNAIRLVADGKMKLPYDKVPLFARALNTEPGELMRRVMREYEPNVLKVMEQVWPAVWLTQNQLRLLALYDRAAKGRDAYPVLATGVALMIAKDSVETDSEP